MNQRTLLTALAAVALLALAAVAFQVTGTFNIFGGSAEQAKAPARNTSAADPFGEDDPTANIKFDGRDEHGRYINGPDGRRIYVDDKGRRYILNPDGTKTYVNEFGQPVDSKGRPLRPGESGRQPGKFGDDTSDSAPTGQPRPDQPPEEEIKTADLVGHVVDDAGKAYAGASVTAQVDGSAAVTVTSGDEGGFKFAGLPSEKSLTLMAADAYGNTSKPVTTKLAPGVGSLKQPLVLPRDTAIRGVVRDADTGLPLDGAQVLLFGANLWTAQTSQTADAGGAFAFGKLTPAAYRLQVSRDGYAPRILNSVEPPANLVVEMSAGAVITGTVKDTGGNPIAGAMISCEFQAEPAQHFHTDALTDEAGYYVVKCQPESQHNSLYVIAPGFGAASKTFVKSGSAGVDFTLTPSLNCVVRGRLLHADGSAVLAATFFSYDAQNSYKKVVVSVGPDAGGVFRCEVVIEAAQLLVRSPGLAEVRAAIVPTAGGEIDLGDLYMGQGYTLFGVVTKKDEPDTKIEGATIHCGTTSVVTAKDGSYRVEGLPAGELPVSVTHPAYVGTAANVKPKAGEYEIEQNFELSNANFDTLVHITDAETQEPIAGAKLNLTAYGITLTSDAQGMVHATGLSSLKIDAVIEKQGYATVNLKILADVPDKTAAKPPQEVPMVPGRAISGVCTSNGEPLPGATKVEIWGTDKLVATLFTDTEGAYASEALPLGQYYVGLPDYHVAARPLMLDDGGASAAAGDFEIGTICHLRGKFMRADGQPHANAGVYIYRRDEVYWSATIHTGPDGKYEVMNLFPGDWVFCALKTQGDSSAQFAVTVSASKAGWTDKDVQLPAITGVITGRVTYPDGEPVKKARVSVTNLGANFPRALLAAYVVTDNDGRYIAERLENGAQMQARVGGYQDEATTGTAFSEVVTISSDSSPVEADIVVAPSGVNVNVAMRRTDGGPTSGGSLCYLFDAEGRMSGLYFGGGVYTGTIYLYDVVPGTYTLVVTNHNMKRAELQITVGSEPITTGLEILIEPHDRSSE